MIYFYDVEPVIHEFLLTAGVLFLAFHILVAYFITAIIDYALQPRARPRTRPGTRPRTVAKEPAPRKPVVPKPKRRPKKLYKVEPSHAAILKSMMDAHEASLKRIREGRKRAVALRKATNEMLKSHYHWIVETNEKVNADMGAVKREQFQALRAWVKEIEDDTTPPLASMEYQNQLLAAKQKEEMLLKQEKAAALESSADKVKGKSTEMPFCKVLGDSKTIKIKFGKNNKLANLLEDCHIGGGFYVSL